jgi:hypothetical protein
MMRLFLAQYGSASDLDDKKYDGYFPSENDRADLLMFDDQVICEIKEFRNIKVKHQAEKLYRKGEMSAQDFKRDFYNTINNALSKANKQIEESKNALGKGEALGLVILENMIQSDLSVLALIDAANRKMLTGLKSVDCVLCVDMVNTFSNSEGKMFRPVQILMRDTERSRRLSELVEGLMNDFCNRSDMPIYSGFEIGKGDQTWHINESGEYYKYEAKFDWQTYEVKQNWRDKLTQFVGRWWWIIPIPAILHDLFTR